MVEPTGVGDAFRAGFPIGTASPTSDERTDRRRHRPARRLPAPTVPVSGAVASDAPETRQAPWRRWWRRMIGGAVDLS